MWKSVHFEDTFWSPSLIQYSAVAKVYEMIEIVKFGH